jgi:hypothetical protein
MKKNKRNRKTRKAISRRRGPSPLQLNVKTGGNNSKVRPGKPFYKTFIFDEINGFFEGLQKFMIQAVDET